MGKKTKRPVYFNDVEQCVEEIIFRVGKKLVVAAPFGIGKPNQLLNALYQRVQQDKSLHMVLLTALNLDKPSWSSELERRLLEPISKRLWPEYPGLEYYTDTRKNGFPENFELVQFFFKPGENLHCAHSQQNFLCSNYTHAVRDGVIQGVNVLVQQLSKKEVNGQLKYSLSSSPDTNLEAGMIMRQQIKLGAKAVCVGQINNKLPFMYGEAVVEPDFFDLIIDNPEYDFQPFGVPKEAVTPTDWIIGLQASALVKDGGTLQIGFGSLGDAVVSGLLMRHRDNHSYNQLLKDLTVIDKFGDLIQRDGGTGIFEQGLHGSSEMLLDTMLELYEEGILKRRVYEHVGLQRLINEGKITEEVGPETLEMLVQELVVHQRLTASDVDFLKKFGIFKSGVEFKDSRLLINGKELSNDLGESRNFEQVVSLCLGSRLKNGIVINASFFLGPNRFYEYLRSLPEERIKDINMRGVNFVNQLYGGEELKTLQRKNGRFINACLMVRLIGTVISHTLDNGQVISGPGGQYNFVAMAHALPDARSIIMVRSFRETAHGPTSNIVWDYGATTIPRHLRDIVISEYGMADLRGKRDKEVIAALLNIADSRFQDSLLRKAIGHGKLPKNHTIPDEFRSNTPERLSRVMKPYMEQGVVSMFPFGTDFTNEEIVLGQALKKVAKKKGREKLTMMSKVLQGIRDIDPEKSRPYLERMDLVNPRGLKGRMYKNVVLYALKEAGKI